MGRQRTTDTRETQGTGRPLLAFAGGARPADDPDVVVHVNFGVFAGREATPAEIDRLAEWLLDRVRHVTIVSEIHHEIDSHSEAAVHQVRIEVDGEGEPEELEPWLVERAELWARMCVGDRTAAAI